MALFPSAPMARRPTDRVKLDACHGGRHFPPNSLDIFADEDLRVYYHLIVRSGKIEMEQAARVAGAVKGGEGQ
jgi:hypothetical protein